MSSSANTTNGGDAISNSNNNNFNPFSSSSSASAVEASPFPLSGDRVTLMDYVRDGDLDVLSSDQLRLFLRIWRTQLPILVFNNLAQRLVSADVLGAKAGLDTPGNTGGTSNKNGEESSGSPSDVNRDVIVDDARGGLGIQQRSFIDSDDKVLMMDELDKRTQESRITNYKAFTAGRRLWDKEIQKILEGNNSLDVVMKNLYGSITNAKSIATWYKPNPNAKYLEENDLLLTLRSACSVVVMQSVESFESLMTLNIELSPHPLAKTTSKVLDISAFRFITMTQEDFFTKLRDLEAGQFVLRDVVLNMFDCLTISMNPLFKGKGNVLVKSMNDMLNMCYSPVIVLTFFWKGFCMIIRELRKDHREDHTEDGIQKKIAFKSCDTCVEWIMGILLSECSTGNKVFLLQIPRLKCAIDEALKFLRPSVTRATNPNKRSLESGAGEPAVKASKSGVNGVVQSSSSSGSSSTNTTGNTDQVTSPPARQATTNFCACHWLDIHIPDLGIKCVPAWKGAKTRKSLPPKCTYLHDFNGISVDQVVSVVSVSKLNVLVQNKVRILKALDEYVEAGQK
jgi:hypothetical protein